MHGRVDKFDKFAITCRVEVLVADELFEVERDHLGVRVVTELVIDRFPSILPAKRRGDLCGSESWLQQSLERDGKERASWQRKR